MLETPRWLVMFFYGTAAILVIVGVIYFFLV
jgi:hypothetical protein